LNDINGDIDAKKACTNAMKLHKKYLKQVPFFSGKAVSEQKIASGNEFADENLRIICS